MNTQGENERIKELEKTMKAMRSELEKQNKKVDSNRFTSYEDIHAHKVWISDKNRKEAEIQFNQAYE